MGQRHVSVRINAPPELVFGLYTDAGRVREWLSGVREVRTAGPMGFGRQQLARLVPPAGPLELLHAGEVDRARQAVCRVQPAEAVPDGLVDEDEGPRQISQQAAVRSACVLRWSRQPRAKGEFRPPSDIPPRCSTFA
jgi:hypothetical protein